MNKISRFLRAVGGKRIHREMSVEKDVAMRVLNDASKDADRILDDAMSRALHETDRAIRRLRSNEGAT